MIALIQTDTGFSHLQRKRIKRCDDVVSRSGDAHQGSSLLWSCNGCQQHEPTSYTGAHQDLQICDIINTD